MPHLKSYYIPCTLPKKLEHLLNEVLENGAVAIKNTGIGGSNLSIGCIVLEYNL